MFDEDSYCGSRSYTYQPEIPGLTMYFGEMKIKIKTDDPNEAIDLTTVTITAQLDNYDVSKEFTFNIQIICQVESFEITS